MVTTGETMGLAEWIIDDTVLFDFISLFASSPVLSGCFVISSVVSALQQQEKQYLGPN